MQERHPERMRVGGVHSSCVDGGWGGGVEGTSFPFDTVERAVDSITPSTIDAARVHAINATERGSLPGGDAVLDDDDEPKRSSSESSVALCP